jgi:dihydroxy-acid dehydratase
MPGPLNRQSRNMTEGVARTPNRAMLRAVGFTDEDFGKPVIGVASAGSELTPCNMHLDDLALTAKDSLREHGGMPLRFNTFVVADGEAMGHEGMKCSLVSREVIADVIELVARGHQMDAVLGIGGCDKTIPGTVMAMARLNLPSIFVYGGTIMPGFHRGKAVDIVSAFEAAGQFSAGKISEEERHAIECASCPGPGACGGMYTANTMSSAAEAMGMALPGNASIPAVDPPQAEGPVQRRESPHGAHTPRHPHAGHHDEEGFRERRPRRHGSRGLHERRASPPRPLPRRRGADGHEDAARRRAAPR